MDALLRATRRADSRTIIPSPHFGQNTLAIVSLAPIYAAELATHGQPAGSKNRRRGPPQRGSQSGASFT